MDGKKKSVRSSRGVRFLRGASSVFRRGDDAGTIAFVAPRSALFNASNLLLLAQAKPPAPQSADRLVKDPKSDRDANNRN